MLNKHGQKNTKKNTKNNQGLTVLSLVPARTYKPCQGSLDLGGCPAKMAVSCHNDSLIYSILSFNILFLSYYKHMKKAKPSLEQMRMELIQFEIEEVYYSKDYQVIIEESPECAWKDEDDILEYFNDMPSEYIEESWLELFNQFGDYNEK